jgi:CheY-like chemotaxis protein
MLAKENLSAEKKNQFLEFIQSSNESLTSIIDDILDISKIEAGQLKILYAPTNIHSLLNELKATFDCEIEKKGLENLALDVSANLPANYLLETDAKRLRQIIVNLVNNAIKFTCSGKIEVRAFVNEQFTITVSDTGIGIPENKLAEIFEPFEQVHESDSNNQKGTGLGLSIVQKLAVFMGGSIHVKSKLSEGSTFTLFLPANEFKTEAIEPIDNTGAENNINWQNRRILVAEDEPMNYMLIEELLSETNVQLTWASDGEKAVNEFIANRNYDLILMDIKMPRMNGHEACVAIRKKDTAIPIIAQTAYAMNGDKEYCLSIGFTAYLTKPFQKTELVTVIGSFFN